MKKLSNILRIILWISFILCLALAIFLWWAVGDNLPKRAKIEIIENEKAILPSFKNEFSVMSYNIAHGQGIKENAHDYRGKDVTIRHLEELSKVIKKADADLLLLQEVDLDSNRTQYIDQIEFIKNKTNYPFHACALVWKKNYVPYPFWPINEQIGYVRAANCILSKYKLSNQYRIIFDKPKNNPWWYNLGYIDRGIQRVDIEIGPQKIAVLNIHLEAWDKKAREEQIKVLADYMKEINLPIILGGDFNTIMPSDPIKKGFKDEPNADLSDEKTFSWLFSNLPMLKIPKIEQKYTFPSDEPTRRLDHIFLLGDQLNFKDFMVADEAKTASDHLPIKAIIFLDNP